MQKILAIALNTFREAIRDRILYGFLFFAVVLLLFTIVLGKLSLSDQTRPTIDIGLAGISLFSVLMAIFLGISLLHKEIERRTIYPILSKPVSRGSFMLGKFVGLLGTMYVQIGLMALVWMGVLFIQGAQLKSGVFVALLLVAMETTVIVALALFFSSFSRPFMSGVFCLGIFAAGRNAMLIEELSSREGMNLLAPILESITAVLPNFYLFYPSGKLIDGTWATVHSQFVTLHYVFSSLGYGVLYTAALIVLSIAILNRRDFV